MTDVTSEPAAEPAQPPASEPPRSSRAGRNVPMATAVGIVLAALVVVTVFWAPLAFAILVTVAFAIAVLELVVSLGAVGVRAPRWPLLAGTVGMLLAAYWGGTQGLLVGFALTVVAIVFWRILSGPDGSVRDITGGVWIAAYAPLMAGFPVLMVTQSHGPQRVIVYIATTICSDIGGFALGVLFGRHAMAPKLSPKKSWEGFAGSVVACIACAVGLGIWLLHLAWWQGALFGLAVVTAATLGDLAESAVKRDVGVKDMGRILPGHGGLMDRLDSLIPVAPIAFVLLTAFVGQ